MPKSAIEYFNETQNYLNSDSYLNKDTQTQDEELRKFNKVFGELVKNETANLDNESVKKYMSQFNKEYNPSERKKWAKSPSKWTDQEYVAQVKDIKSSPEWEELTDKERNDLNIEFGNEYRLRKLAKGESIEAVDYNANQDANQRVADYYNENAKAAVEYLGELAGQHWHLDDNQPKEVKDLTLGNAAKAALKSAARIPGSVASSGLGFLGGLTGLAGSAIGSDTLKDLGAVMGTGANSIDAVNQAILPPEQKAIEGIKDIIPGMGDRTFGQKVLTGIDQLPEQLGTWIMPGVMAKTAKGAVEGAKAYRLAKNLKNLEKVSKEVKKSAELASKLPKLGKLSIGAKKSADLAQFLGLHNLDPEKATKFAGTLGSMGLELSEMFKNATAKEGEVKNPLHMGLMAAGAGLLEDWVPSKLFRMDKLKPATRAMLRRDFGKGFWKSSKAFIGNLGKDTIRNIASEGGTELLQTYLEQAAANRNAGGSWFLPYDDAVKIKKLLNEKGLEGVIEEAKHNERLADIVSATVLGGISGGLGNIGSNAGNYISYNTSPEGYLDRYRENREALINGIDNAKTDEERNQKQQQLDQLDADLTNWKLSNPDNAARGDFDTIYRSFEEMANAETSDEDLKDAFRTLSRLSDDSFLNYTSLLQEAGWENNPTFYNNLDKLIKYREDINFKSLPKTEQNRILNEREEAERQAKIAEEQRIKAEEEAKKQAEFKKQYGDLEKALLERAGYINLENQEKINQLLARVTDEGQKAELNRRLEELKKEEAEIYRRMGYAEDEAALQPNTQTEEQQNQPLYYNADGSPVYDTANVNVQQKTFDNTSKEEIEKNISKHLATKKKLEGFLKKTKDPEKIKKLKRSLDGANKKLNELYSNLNNNQQVNSITDSIKTRQAEEKLAKKEQENESLRNTIAGLQSQGNLKDVKGQSLPNGKSGFVGNRARLKAGDIDTECDYAIVELSDLQTLSDEENPRQRNDRQAYANTVSERARNLDPDLLIDNSVGAQNGPIVVDQNLKVESGNGRTLSLREAYANRKGEGEYSGAQTDAGYGRADLYRNKLIAEAPKYGISSEQVMQMKEPVLVRIRVADSNINAKDFWAKANNSQQEAMSSTETAMVDGEKIKPLLKQFEAIGDIRAKSNLDFVKSFLEKICSPYELNSMFTADGKSLSEAGEKRINNAIIAAAYGDSEIVSLLTELGNEDVQTILNGLAMAAPDTAKLMGEAQQGFVYDVDYSKDLADAIRTIKNLRQNPDTRNLIKQFGSVGEVYLRQGTLGDDGLSPTARLFIGVLGNLNNKETISNFIKAVNNAVRKEGSPSQLGMFEVNTKPSDEVFVERAISNMGLKVDAERYEKGPSSVASNDDFHAEDAQGKRYSKGSEDYRTEAERLADDGTTATREEFDNVIQNVNDSIDPDAGISFEIYDSVEDFNKDRADNDKAPSDANAFIATKTDKKTGKKTSKIVLFRDKLTTLTRLKQVVAHELVGHEGIERLLGGRYYNIFLKSIRGLARRDGRVGKLLAQVQRTYGRFYSPESHQMYEELGAHLAELYARKPERFSDRVHSYIRKLRMMFRNALRNWGVNIEFNEVDLEDILAKARDAVETNTANESSDSDFGRRYSRGRKTDDKNQLTFDLDKDYEEEFNPIDYYGKDRYRLWESYQKNGNVIYDILPRINIEEDYGEDYGYEELPAAVEALNNLTDNGEFFANIDYEIGSEASSKEPVEMLERLKERVARTFYKPFADKIISNCDKAIDMIRRGEFKEGVIEPIDLEELEAQPVKRMPRSDYELDSWREDRRKYDEVRNDKHFRDIYGDEGVERFRPRYSLGSNKGSLEDMYSELNTSNEDYGEDYEGEDFASLMDQIDGKGKSENGKLKDSVRFSLSKIESLTEDDVKDMLYKASINQISGYIPVRRNTPKIIVDFAKDFDEKAGNYPLIIEASKIPQIFDDSENWDPKQPRPHNYNEDIFIALMKSLDDPAYIVLQNKNKNKKKPDAKRFGVVTKFYDGKKKHDALAVIEFKNNKEGDILNGYPGGVYNINVTSFDPDDIQKYLYGEDSEGNKNIVIYDKIRDKKKYDESQRESGNSAPSHLNDSPYASIITKNSDNGNPYGSAPEGRMYSISNMWTGSAADYEQPSTDAINSGMGGQVFGYGLYASSERGVGEYYAETDYRNKGSKAYQKEVSITARENKVEKFANNIIEKINDARTKGFVSSSFVSDLTPLFKKLTTNNKWYVSEDVNSVIDKSLEELYNKYSSLLDSINKRNTPINTTFKNIVEDIEKKFESLKWAKGNIFNEKFEFDFEKIHRNLYRQTAFPYKQENLIDWYEPVSKENKELIVSKLKDKLRNEYTKEEFEAFLSDPYNKQVLDNDSVTGEKIYKFLTELLWSPKEASDFLYSIGIDGIKYPTGTLNANRNNRSYDNGFNIVVFNDKDLRVDEHIRYSLGKDGKLDLNGERYSPATIEDHARNWFMDAFDFDMNGDTDTPIDIVNCKVVGSRAKGTSNADSDLDVVLEYDDPTDSWSEDSVYNILNEVPMELNGVKVDINPIKKEDSGTLEDWLERNYDYDKNEDKSRRFSLTNPDESTRDFAQRQADKYNIRSLNDSVNVQKQVLNSLPESFYKDVFVNSTGDTIKISKKGIKETFAFKNFSRLPRLLKACKLAVLDDLDKLLSSSERYVSDEKNYHTGNKETSFDYFKTPVEVDGKPCIVKFDIKKGKDGKRLYLYRIEIEKQAQLDLLPENGEAQKSSDLSNDNLQQIPRTRKFSLSSPVESQQFKNWFGDWENDPSNASKVVDEDGRPLVVYHGTDADFEAFDHTKGRGGMDIQGMFFSPWEIDAKGYGKNLGKFYLNLRNPANEDVAYKALRKFKGQNYAGKKAREYLIEQGYDGVIMGVEGQPEEYIAFYPNQIKSATDNNGKFDSNDDRYRFSLAGTKAKTANIATLDEAKKMLADGADKKEVWQKTGWYIAKDGKPRFEISDDAFEYDLNLDVIKRWIEDEKKSKRGESIDYINHYEPLRLSDVIEHDKLFEAYPILQGYTVYFENSPSSKTLGRFNSQFNSITLNIKPDSFDTESVYPIINLKKTLIHEIQHAIQEYEGFAKGTSPEYEKRKIQDSYIKKIREVINSYEGSEETKVLLTRYSNIYKDFLSAERQYLLIDEKEHLDKYKDYNEQVKEMERDILDEIKLDYSALDEDDDFIYDTYDELLSDIQKSTRLAFGFNSDVNSKAKDNYRKSYGEGEARVAEKRLDYEDFDRAEFMPEDDFDYNVDDSIIEGVEYDDNDLDDGAIYSSEDNGRRYSLDGRPYYQIPFDEAVDLVISNQNNSNNIDETAMVFVSETPQALKEIGVVPLPIMVTQDHIRSIYFDDSALRKYYKNSPSKLKKLHAHDMGDLIKQIPQALKNPAMIITSATHPDTSIVAITVMKDQNGDDVVVPIKLEGNFVENGDRINAMIMTSAQGRKNAYTKLVKDAIEKEKNGEVGVFYCSKIGKSLLNLARMQFPSQSAGDLIHSINDPKSPVKRNITSQNQTYQFKNWFGKSIITEDGKPGGTPKILYHGTDQYGFDIFRDNSFFTPDYEYAKRYESQRHQDYKPGTYEVYLRIEKPFDIRKPKDRKIFTEYRNGHEPTQTDSGAMEWTDFDYDDLTEYLKDNYKDQYDGYVIHENNNDSLSYVPFEKSQIKSATDNIGTFDRNNDNIRYSLSSDIDDRLNEMSDYVDKKLGRKLDKKDIDSLKAILGTDKDSDIELNDIPTLKQRSVEFKDWLAKSIGQLIQGFVGDTQSKAERKKAPYLWQKDHSTEKLIETPYEISRRHNIEEGMKIREEEDRLVLKHLDADKNFFTGLIRKITKPGPYRDWMLKKASRILAPFQMMKPVENLLFTVAENIMWDEAKQQMVIAPYRDVELDGNNKPIGYKYDPNEKNGRLALDIYNNSLNDDFKAIIKERSIANNKFREDFVNRVVPYEQAKLYLAKYARKRLEGASKRIVDGNSQQAYSYITRLKGVIDDIDYKNLISQYDQIRNVPENQLGRNSAHINSIIGELTGNPGISSNGIDGKLRWLTTNKGLYGYAHHLVSIDPENGSGKPFNALSNLSHPWIETIAGDRRGRKTDSNENRSLLKADLERNRKEAEAEAANRWMEDTENQYGITVEEAKILEAKAQKGEGPGMPEGYEHRHKVVANFGKFRGKIIYLPDETFEAYQMVRDNRSLDSMKQFGDFMQGLNNINGRINEAMLYHPGKAMRDLMAGPFHLLEFLRDWSMKHPTEIADACKAMLHGIKNSVSPEYWQSHTPESMGEYSESVFYQGSDKQSPTVKLLDSVFKYFQKAIPVGQTLEAIRKEVNLSGGADIPLKRIFTTIGEELADKRGLTGQERERFIYDMVNDYAFDTGDLPEIIAWLRGKKADSKSQALGMISRATVPFMGYATRMLKQMLTDPVTKGAFPLAKRAFGKADADSNIRSEISEISRPFFWLLLKALISAGLGGLLPEPTAEEIQDMPGLPPSARTHGRFYIGDSERGERFMSTKGLGQLETASLMSDFLHGKSDIIDFSSEFLTIHPIAKYIANLSGMTSEYDRKIPFTTQTGKLLAGLILPEITTRFTDDVAKLTRAYMEKGTTDRRRQTFIQAFFEKLLGIPRGQAVFDKEGHLRLSDPALESLKMLGVNIREIPFDTIEETTRAEASRISNDAKRIKKLEDYRAGKYAPKTEMEFLKQDFGGDFSSVEEAEKAYSNLAERERRLVDTATKLHRKGHWTDLEDIAREKKEAAAEKRKLQNEGKPTKRRRPSRKRKVERPLLNDDLGYLNNEIRKNISGQDEYQELYDKLIQNNKKHNPRRGVAGQLERLLKELK